MVLVDGTRVKKKRMKYVQVVVLKERFRRKAGK
jgi:hypothetical protein